MKRFLLYAAGALAAIGLALALAKRREPPEVLFNGKTVSAWALDALTSPSAATRDNATSEIRALGTNAVPELIQLLDTPDPVLAKPVRKLVRVLPAKAGSRLFRVSNPFEASCKRAAAAQALRVLGGDASAAVPALSRALNDDQTASWYAALALAQLGQPGTDALIKALPRTSPIQSGYVCYALGTQGMTASNAIPALTRSLQEGTHDVAEKAATALSNMGRLAVPYLTQTLAHKDPQVRMLSINALAGIGPLARDALPNLIEVMRKDQPQVRQAAVQALAQIRPTAPVVVAALAEALHDPDRDVRLKAVRGLSRSGHTSIAAAPAVIRALKDESVEVRAQAAALLGDMDGPRDSIIPALRETLDDESEVVRGTARQALERLHNLPSPAKTG